MKYYLLLLSIFLAGCNHQSADKKMHIYYGTPKLDGIISVDEEPFIGAPVFLLTSCNDQQAIVDSSGYFDFSNNCMELIPQVNYNELGFLYRVIIPFNGDNLTWAVSGLGYGIKNITALINLTTKTVVYRIDDGVNPVYEKVGELTPLLTN
ncbi:hypothetical protein DM558_04125 [Entomomonas moraniae]|uniref:Uncharacterized protein n=1 Tax=Entomomonas moraniae TaxID=2213226 RepID=A0A3Q9JI02_9GAMM|nr:hypothetical protein [Entomomonas moraniae]AZS50013.1 hypothetical protein DM558_04125 [Entomomonas moraniae]